MTKQSDLVRVQREKKPDGKVETFVKINEAPENVAKAIFSNVKPPNPRKGHFEKGQTERI